MAEVINPDFVVKTIESWCQISIDKFQENLIKMNIGELDGDLMRSFTSEVKKQGGDAFQVLIHFLNYGRLRDMQVGRGHKIGNPKYAAEGKWYSKTKTKEVSILRFILAKKYSLMAVQLLENELKAIDKKSR